MNDSNIQKRRNKYIWLKAGIVFLLVLAILWGVSMILTPYLENKDYRDSVMQQVTSFKERVAVYKEAENNLHDKESDLNKQVEQYQELWDAMTAYNKKIYETGQEDLADAWSYETDVFDMSEYGLENEAVGLVTIPDINVEMPLYLGASYDNLAAGFAQLSQTSMPTGGKNTNCVIAGHRGWKGMAYMRDVELLEIGDPVYIENLWETLEYRIREIKVIEPYEVECCFIQEGKDLLTIVTCHPYGVGSERIIVICERYNEGEAETIPAAPEESGEWVWEWHDRVQITTSDGSNFESSQLTIFLSVYLPWICLILAMMILFITLFVLFITHKRSRKANKDKEESV